MTIDEKNHGTRSIFHGSLLKKDSKRSYTEVSRSGASGNLCNNEVTVHVGFCHVYGFCRKCWSNVWMVFASEQDCLEGCWL